MRRYLFVFTALAGAVLGARLAIPTGASWIEGAVWGLVLGAALPEAERRTHRRSSR